MNCPELERLLEVFVDGAHDEELNAHVARCPDCTTYLTLLQALPAALDPDVTVPEALLDRTAAALAALPEADEETESGGLVLAVLLSGFLGGATTLGFLIVAGVAGAGTLAQMLLASVGVGAGTMVWKATIEWRGNPGLRPLWPPLPPVPD
jgi:hypothetical protein